MKKNGNNRQRRLFGRFCQQEVLRTSCCNNIYSILAFGSGGLILLLGLVLINPNLTMGHNVGAITKDDPITAEVNTNVAALVRSSISVAVTSKVDLDLTPSSKGTFSTSAAKLDVTTNNTTGYAVYLRTRDDSSTLRPAQTGVTEVIGAPTGTITESNYTNNLDTWGYAITSSSNDSITTSGNVVVADSTKAEYQAIPTSADPAIIRTDKTDQEDSYELSFGVAISPTLPSGIYNNEVIVSVVANPIEVRSLIDLTFMQDMTPEVCKISIENETKQLIDSRDGKSYWVAKLKDGNCWMVQNLALIFGENEGQVNKLTNLDSDLNSKTEWVLNTNLATLETNPNNAMRPTEPAIPEYTASTLASNTRSWNFGKWVHATPLVSRACNVNDLAFCTANNVVDVSDSNNFKPGFVSEIGDWSGVYPSENTLVSVRCTKWNGKTCIAGEYDEHYLLGSYYQFNAVTAGSGSNLANDSNAQDSICPKGWMLPTGGAMVDKGFQNLLFVYGMVGEDGRAITDESRELVSGGPLHLFLSGDMYLSRPSKVVFGDVGGQGWYWSSRKNSSQAVYRLFLTGSSINSLYADVNFPAGLSARCVAR